MEVREALKLLDGSGWHYTVSNSAGRFPIGYCSGWTFDDERPSLVPAELVAEERKRAEPFRHKFHTHGHATPEEARRCWLTYMVDLLARPSTCDDEMKKCCECSRWTQRRVRYAGEYKELTLCDEHQGSDFQLKHLE